MSQVVRKPTICICENEGEDQPCGKCEADQTLRIVHSLSFLNRKCHASSHILSLRSPVYVDNEIQTV